MNRHQFSSGPSLLIRPKPVQTTGRAQENLIKREKSNKVSKVEETTAGTKKANLNVELLQITQGAEKPFTGLCMMALTASLLGRRQKTARQTHAPIHDRGRKWESSKGRKWRTL